MRKDVKQKHFSTLLREISIGACFQATATLDAIVKIGNFLMSSELSKSS